MVRAARARSEQCPAVFYSGFRYSYMARLIDDSELSELDTARLRKIHKEAYWYNLRLLRRDIRRSFEGRQILMAASKGWDLGKLVAEMHRADKLILTLFAAGVAHTFHVGIFLDHAQRACKELEYIMARTALTSSPASLAV